MKGIKEIGRPTLSMELLFKHWEDAISSSLDKKQSNQTD